jgi:hypothetical protein
MPPILAPECKFCDQINYLEEFLIGCCFTKMFSGHPAHNQVKELHWDSISSVLNPSQQPNFAHRRSAYGK